MADETNNAAAELAVEHIPGTAIITRLIDSPRMYEAAKGLIWESTFEFPGGTGESVNWDKYAPPPDEVHRLGQQRQLAKQAQRHEFTYAGYISAETEHVRTIRTVRGHGFDVEHVPSEGIHHAEIRRRVSDVNALNKGDKGELRFALQRVFDSLVPCPDERQN
ncbi:hypothetical protein [Burkholderia arboris]|uniref:hypothetical protein n=1 Tax=Burkholderia arboris TaxID=488730 RepID=UPI001CF1FC0B|nr:hypothetical protein [Burkholderia arboris]MCA8051298.1 hypothetical protein [Burkholderia arboris]